MSHSFSTVAAAEAAAGSSKAIFLPTKAEKDDCSLFSYITNLRDADGRFGGSLRLVILLMAINPLQNTT